LSHPDERLQELFFWKILKMPMIAKDSMKTERIAVEKKT
jgi:hypothetical protein